LYTFSQARLARWGIIAEMNSAGPIRIVHFHHDDEHNLNIGDQAHVVAIHEQLERFSDRPIEFIEKPSKLLSYHAVPSIFYYPKSKYYPLFVQNLYRKLHGISAKDIAEECNNADMVLIGGGGFYMSYLFPLNNDLIQRIQKPLVVFGVGYNQNIGSKAFTKKQAESVRVLSSQATLQMIRDYNTQDFLQTCGVDSAEIMCDPAIFLSERNAGLVQKTKKLAIGINMARHGWDRQSEMEQQFIETYTQICKTVAERHDAQFFYMMHQPKERVYFDALKDTGIDISLVQTDDARELKAAYAQLDVSLSMMLHSSILAFGAGTPIVEVGYDLKNEAFMKLIGQEDLYTTIDDLDAANIVALLESAITRKSALKKALAARKNEFQAVYDDATRRVLATIAPSGQ